MIFEGNGFSVLEAFTEAKNGTQETSGDALYISESFIAVIDGATAKGNRLWNGMKGDPFVAALLKNAMASLPFDISAQQAIDQLNTAVKREYARLGISGEALAPEERLQASIVIFSALRREIWLFGDCQFRVNDKNYTFTRKGDALLADLRAFWREADRLEGVANAEKDAGREVILPFLRRFTAFANTDSEFGYKVINGCPLILKNVIVHPLSAGDRAVLASDGYAVLYDTLEQTEKQLLLSLKKDPACENLLRSTKGLVEGNLSFDDRTYVRFVLS